MKLQRLYRGRRLYSLLAFLGLASLMFICFQLFSFKVLNLQSEHEANIAKKTYGSKSNGARRSHDAGDSHQEDTKSIHANGNIKTNDGLNKTTQGKMKETQTGLPKNGMRQDNSVHGAGKHNGQMPREEERGVQIPQGKTINEKCIPGKDCPQDWQAGLHVGEDEGKVYAGNLVGKDKKNEKLDRVIDGVMKSDKDSGQMGNKALGDDWSEQDYEGLPTGLLPSMKQSYIPDEEGKFTCLVSKERIPFSYVNDDYCDCSDSSDEPGTSACPDARFYCRFQLSYADPVSLHSSLVNDGICDCCDGSDEWLHLELFGDVKFEDKSGNINIYHSPCSDRCQEFRARKTQEEEIRRKGAEIKQEYLEKAKEHKLTGGYYGPANVFFPLSQDCFNVRFDKYQYEVCPFMQVSQQSDGQSAVGIGRNPQWVSQGGKEGFVLEMDGGDFKGCPGSMRRKSIIRFECGVTDEVTSVLETEVCEYTIKLSTPAAC